MVAKTDRGRIRESNQDAYFVGEMPDGTAFAVVCDGMGGAAGGNIASSLAVQVISSKINASYHPNMRDSSICNMLESALSAANVEVYDLAQEKADLRGMGTTVVCAVIRGGQAFIAHAGDSRAYLFSADGLQQVTTDHSMVQDLLESGKTVICLDPEQELTWLCGKLGGCYADLMGGQFRINFLEAKRWDVDGEDNPDAPEGRNTPFGGKTLRGKVKYTIVGGEIVYWEGE